MRSSWMLPVLLLAPLVAPQAAPEPFEDRSARFVSVGDLESVPDGVAGALAEDARGFLWIATSRGLLRFDGLAFRRYLADPQDPHGLPGNLVRSLLATADGVLWVGTDTDGLARYDADGERFQPFRHDPAVPDSLPPGAVQALATRRSGGLWIGTRGGGLALLMDTHGASGAFLRVGGGDAARGQVVHALLEDRRGDLWVGSRAGLGRLAGGDPHATLEPWPLPAAATVYSLAEGPDDRLWVGTQDGTLYLIDRAGGEVTSLPPRPAAGFEGFDSISAQVLVGTREMWLGRSTGIEVRDAMTGELLRWMSHDRALPSGLAGNEIRALLVDRAGLLWVAGFGGGVQHHDPGNRAIRVLRGAPGHGGTFAQPDIAAILQRRNGEVWLGMRGSGIAVLDEALEHVGGFAPGLAPEAALPVAWVTALAERSDGSVWVGSREGLHLRAASGKAFQRYSEGDFVRAVGVRRLLVDRSDRLWVASNDGVYRVDPLARPPTRLRGRDGEPLRGEFNAIAEDGEGGVWLGGTLGLFRLSDGGDEAMAVAGPRGDGLPHGSVLGILVDSAGRVWVDTAEGMVRVIPEGAGYRFEPLPGSLPGRDSFGANLLADVEGRIWSHRYVHDPGAGWTHRLTPADGVDFGTGWFRAYAGLRDGRLLFGGSRGLLVIAPGAFRRWDYVPPLVITSLRIGGREAPVGRLRGELVLAPRERSVSLEFAALDYSGPERVRYAWRLAGADDDWIAADAGHRVASFGNLWPGRYRFELQASNRAGQWSGQVLAVPVRVLPAWWQTPWFLGLVLLFLVLGYQLALRMRTAYMRERARELTRLVEQRTAELSRAKSHAETALAELRRTQSQLVEAEKMASLGQLVAGVAHEINTPIGIALTAASHLRESSAASAARLRLEGLSQPELERWVQTVEEASGLVLGGLERASRLIGSFKQVAVDQSSEQRRSIDLGPFLEEVRTALAPSYRKSGHRLDIECRTGIVLDTYPGALFQVLTNLVQNALRHAFAEHPEGTMRIAVQVEGDAVLIRFSDDGCGMDAEVAARAFEPFFTTSRASGGSGLGLHLVYNLCTRLLGGHVELQTAPGRGSAFLIRLPLVAPERRTPADARAWAASAPSGRRERAA
jgi:signal transduction histidine kinase/ligand-binding sensor domain-containing protein